MPILVTPERFDEVNAELAKEVGELLPPEAIAYAELLYRRLFGARRKDTQDAEK